MAASPTPFLISVTRVSSVAPSTGPVHFGCCECSSQSTFCISISRESILTLLLLIYFGFVYTVNLLETAYCWIMFSSPLRKISILSLTFKVIIDDDEFNSVHLPFIFHVPYGIWFLFFLFNWTFNSKSFTFLIFSCICYLAILCWLQMELHLMVQTYSILIWICTNLTLIICKYCFLMPVSLCFQFLMSLNCIFIPYNSKKITNFLILKVLIS